MVDVLIGIIIYGYCKKRNNKMSRFLTFTCISGKNYLCYNFVIQLCFKGTRRFNKFFHAKLFDTNADKRRNGTDDHKV